MAILTLVDNDHNTLESTVIKNADVVDIVNMLDNINGFRIEKDGMFYELNGFVSITPTTEEVEIGIDI